jgi:hypothetical protein
VKLTDLTDRMPENYCGTIICHENLEAISKIAFPLKKGFKESDFCENSLEPVVSSTNRRAQQS